MQRRAKAVFGSILFGVSLSLAVPVAAGTPEALKVQGAEAFKGTSQVAIGAFNIGFIFESIDQTAATGGLMGAFGGTTKAKSELVGVTPEMMQQVADAAYADFVAQMTAAGITVQDPAALFSSEALAKAKGQASPLDINIALEKGSKGKATYVKPAALPLLMMIPGDFQGSGMSSIGINMAAGQGSMALSNYAKSAGVPVVTAVYLIDFSQQKRPGAFSFGGLKVNANLSVTPTYSRVSVLGSNGRTTTVTLKQGVSVDGEFIDQQDTTSGLSKGTQAAANVAGGVAAVFGLGGMRFGKTREYQFTAKPGNYQEGAVKAASLANEKVIAALSTLR